MKVAHCPAELMFAMKMSSATVSKSTPSKSGWFVYLYIHTITPERNFLVLVYLTWPGAWGHEGDVSSVAGGIEGAPGTFTAFQAPSDNVVMCLFDFIKQNKNHLVQNFRQSSLYFLFLPFF